LEAYPKHGYFGVRRLLKYIYSIREDIQALFKLDHKQDVIKLNQWFYLCGLKEHGYLELIDKYTLAYLNQPMVDFWHPENNSTELTLLSPLLFFTWSLDANIQALFNLKTASGREHFLGWFFLKGFII